MSSVFFLLTQAPLLTNSMVGEKKGMGGARDYFEAISDFWAIRIQLNRILAETDPAEMGSW